MKKRKKMLLSIMVVFLFIVFVITISPRTMQNDTFWSIKVGEKLINDGIFGTDEFSIHEGLYYIAHHFLTDILIYLVYSFSGFTGLYVMEVIMAIIMAGMLYLLNKEICKDNFLSTVMLFLQLFIMSMYIAVRAQMISYILFILELLLLEKYKKEAKKRYLFGLGIIPLILANFHMGTVPFYFVILGVYILSLIRIKLPFLEWTEKTDKKRLKQLLAVAIIGVMTIFINPYFIDGVVYPFKTFGNDFINSTIQEFKNFRISFDGGYTFIYMALVICTLIFLRNKVTLGDFLLFAGTLFMSFTAIRYIGLFIICSSVVLRNVVKIDISNIVESDIKAAKFTLVILLVLIVGYKGYNYVIAKDVQHIPVSEYPVEAVSFLKRNMNEKDRIFNYYDWGSYLMLNDIKVYIDSRCDLYTKEYNGIDIAGDHNKLLDCDVSYKEIIDNYGINVIIIPNDIPFARLIKENTQFEEIYIDDMAVIYKKI